MEQMLIVNPGSVKATREKLNDPARTQEAIDDIKKMIEIKQTLLWRADAGTCCGSLCNIASFLSREITILENALNALGENNKVEAIRSLEEYQQILESNNGPCEPKSC